MKNFNGLPPAESERLAILAEECGEVVQACMKVMRHGYESTNPKKLVPEDEFPETNRWALEREVGDLLHSIRRMLDSGDLNEQTINARAAAKAETVARYLHHQGPA